MAALQRQGLGAMASGRGQVLDGVGGSALGGGDAGGGDDVGEDAGRDTGGGDAGPAGAPPGAVGCSRELTHLMALAPGSGMFSLRMPGHVILLGLRVSECLRTKSKK